MHIRNPQATIIITTAAETPTPRNTCKFNFVDLVPGTTFSRGITALGAGELPGRENHYATSLPGHPLREQAKLLEEKLLHIYCLRLFASLVSFSGNPNLLAMPSMISFSKMGYVTRYFTPFLV